LLLLALGDQGIQSAHQAAHRSEPLVAGLSGWFVMCVAMMIPAASLHARQLALSTRWQRRQRTITLFFAAYIGVWMAFGLVLLAPATVIQGWTEFPSPPLLALTLTVGGIWALMPWKWRAVRRCHLTKPLPPNGSKGDQACVGEGLRYGRWCLVADGPLMLAMFIAGHGALGLMAILSALMLGEKVMRRPYAHRQAMALVPVCAVLVLALD
jgi:predicted metal-binding membrane protein